MAFSTYWGSFYRGFWLYRGLGGLMYGRCGVDPDENYMLVSKNYGSLLWVSWYYGFYCFGGYVRAPGLGKLRNSPRSPRTQSSVGSCTWSCRVSVEFPEFGEPHKAFSSQLYARA